MVSVLLFRLTMAMLCLLIILVRDMKKIKIPFDEWSKLYFSLNAQSKNQILNGHLGLKVLNPMVFVSYIFPNSSQF